MRAGEQREAAGQRRPQRRLYRRARMAQMTPIAGFHTAHPSIITGRRRALWQPAAHERKRAPEDEGGVEFEFVDGG